MNKLNIDLYYIPASPVDAEIKVKGSKFIAGVIPAVSYTHLTLPTKRIV